MKEQDKDGVEGLALFIGWGALLAFLIALSPLVAQEMVWHSKPGQAPAAQAYLDGVDQFMKAKPTKCTAHRFAPLGCMIEQRQLAKKQ